MTCEILEGCGLIWCEDITFLFWRVFLNLFLSPSQHCAFLSHLGYNAHNASSDTYEASWAALDLTALIGATVLNTTFSGCWWVGSETHHHVLRNPLD